MKAYLGETVAFTWEGAALVGAVQSIGNGRYWIKAGEDMYRVKEAAIVRIEKWSDERHQALGKEMRRRLGNG